MQTVKKTIIILLALFAQIFVAQETQNLAGITTASSKYENFAYIDAIKSYERIIKKGYKSADLFEKIANSYYFNAELAEAKKWYTELFSMTEPISAENYYRFSQTLKSVGDYKKADEMLNKFNQLAGNDERAKIYSNERNYLDVIKGNSGRYQIKNVDFNSNMLDYGATVVGNKLIFASNRKFRTLAKRTIKWNNQAFTNLYEATIGDDGSLADVKLFSNKINLRFDEATPVFSNDGSITYFTRSNSVDLNLQKDVTGTTGLKIYRSKYESDKWSEAEPLSINSDEFSVAHPALSPDGKTLYYTSNMQGSYGDSDLYKSEILADGSIGQPVNLGRAINTPGRESFPFVSADNELYFATDARQGLGGLDVFVCKINADGSFTTPVNVGAPINDTTDDFAFYIDSKTRKGFFSSNRPSGKGFDDIYSFVETSILKFEHEINGMVTDETTSQVIPFAKVLLLDSKMQKLAEGTSNQNGEYKFAVSCGEVYYIQAVNADYEVKEIKVIVPNKNGSTMVPIVISKKVIVLKVNDDISKMLKLKNIYFDLDKAFVRNDAALELEMVLDVMNQYPTIKVDVRSHTDSRQTNKYNEGLSDRRAKASIAWLVKNGITADRLTGKGYGESELLNSCADGATCTEEEHQVNRRSEFIIVKF